MSALQSMIASIADERDRRDALGGTRERGNPPPDYVPNVDSTPVKGSPATVLSSSVGPDEVVYSAKAGSTGPVYSYVGTQQQVPQSDANHTTGFGRPLPPSGGNLPGAPQAPTLTDQAATVLLPPGAYSMAQINQAASTPA